MERAWNGTAPTLKEGFEDEPSPQEEKQGGGRRAVGGPPRGSRMNEQTERWGTVRTDDWRRHHGGRRTGPINSPLLLLFLYPPYILGPFLLDHLVAPFPPRLSGSWKTRLPHLLQNPKMNPKCFRKDTIYRTLGAEVGRRDTGQRNAQMNREAMSLKPLDRTAVRGRRFSVAVVQRSTEEPLDCLHKAPFWPEDTAGGSSFRDQS